MKLRNILIVITSFLFAATACVEESFITPPIPADGTLSIRFTPVMTITKAATELGYTYADADEIKINSIALAIFNTSTGALVGYKYETFTEASDYYAGGVNDKKPYYEMTVATKTGTLEFLAIANSTTITSEATLLAEAQKGQAAFEACVEDSGDPVFDPTNLVKFGKLEATLTPTDKSVEIPLTQLAARVDVGISIDEEDTNWNFFMSKYTITNGINTKSKVFLPVYNAASYLYNDQRAFGTIIAGDGTIDLDKQVTRFTFYTYERKTNDKDLKIAIDGYLVDKTDTNIQEAKSYELVLNPSTTDGSGSATDGLIHGYYYDIKGKISMTSMKITFNTRVEPWSNIIVEIGAVIKEIHYLVVKETVVYMPNISTYLDDYRSDSPITISEEKGTYTNYELSGVRIVKKENVLCTGTQIPTVTVEGNQIKITSTLPTNSFPKKITFKVTNEAGLTENVTVTQYPAYYLTGEVTRGGGPELPGDVPELSRNPNIFTITIIDPDGLPKTQADGKTQLNPPLRLGVPAGPDGQTLNTVEANNMISPRFMVASRQAVVSTTYYTSNMAIARCKTYWETGEDGTLYPAGSWRIPTLAELEFMNIIQDGNPSVSYLFNTDGQYWSALPGWYYNFQPNTRVNLGDANKTISGGGARCVRDIY